MNENLSKNSDSSPTFENQSPQDSPSLWQATRFWLKLGFVSFGGPAGQIAIMHRELVEQKRWISESRFLHALNYCMLLPGPEAQQLATYIGWLLHRTRGGIIAGALFVLPSLAILIALSWVYMAFGHLTLVAGFFYGIKPAVAALVAQAAYRVGSRALKNSLLWSISAAAFVAIFFLHIAFPLIILSAALIGFLGGKFSPQFFSNAGGHKGSDKKFGAALIDDDTPIPEHAHFKWKTFALVIASGAILWILPFVALYAVFGVQHTYTQMALFFSKAALLTFGGAYAVLPYVYQGAVIQYQWLKPTQMIDGLALGETTPGPLIMVVAFVGFVGGYAQALAANESAFIAGVFAASLVTWFTFLPSFIFILAGGPFIESTHNQLKFTAPLTAITAAVVGVIVSLALFFAEHTFWPQGIAHGLDFISLIIAALTAIALFYFKRGVIEVILGAGVLGLVKVFLL